MELVHYIAEGSNYDGAAQNAGRTSGGLFTLTNIPERMWATLLMVWWDIEGTTPNLTNGIWDIIDVTTGTLLWDTQTTGPGAETLITGGTSLETGVVEDITDDGADGAILMSEISGQFTDGEGITGDVDFDGDANGVVTFARQRLKTSSSLQFQWSWKPGEKLVKPQLGAGGDTAENALCQARLVTTGMSTGFGTAGIVYAQYHPERYR
jgi:hypothetical protein